MNTDHTVPAALAGLLLSLFVTSAAAQAAQPAGPSRADVKAETARAHAAGEIVRGEGASAKEPKFKATKTREQRKAETREAAARGEVTSRGDAQPQERMAPSGGPQTARADVKKEAVAANKAGTTRRNEASPGQSR